MAKRVASSSPHDASPVVLSDQLSQSAQRQLGTLRSALDKRIAALEEVLADPSRGESLAGLILDLSRVATEEAQVAAAQACIATKVDADTEIAALRASTKAALDTAQAAVRSAEASRDHERAIGIELRNTVEQAELEQSKQADALVAREQLDAALRGDRDRFEAEAVRQQAIATDLKRVVADATQQVETARRAAAESQSQLEAERAGGAAVKRSAESAVARVATVERELAEKRSAHEVAVANLAEARAAHDVIAGDLARERQASADRDRAHSLLQSQLETERGVIAELRQAVARAEALGATMASQSSASAAAHDDAALSEARNALAAVQADLDAERATLAEIRQAAESSDQQLTSARSNEAQAVADHQMVAAQLEAVVKERESIADELIAARKWINELREAEADFALPPAPPHAAAGAVPPVEAAPAKPKPKGSTSAPAKAPKAAPGPAGGPATEESWQAVRLASRYVFNPELSVQVNGDAARLFDLSISGCQLLSPTALKPNQIVKVLLPSKPALTCAGKVVWTRLEPMGVGQPLGYRAGVRFTKPDEAAIDAFASSRVSPA